jgi:tetratricopeptide (TPR) repeat protein
MGKRAPWIFGLLAAAVAVAVLGFNLYDASVTGGSTHCTTTRPTAPPALAHGATAQDYYALGNSAFDRGNCAAAIAAYTQALALDPHNARAYNNRAYTYMLENNYAAALPDLDQAIALRPTYVNALMNRGDIYNFYKRQARGHRSSGRW